MKEKKQDLAMPIAIVIAGILIAGAVIYSDTEKTDASKLAATPNNIETMVENSTVDQRDLISSTGHIRGDKKAPLTLVEFSDPECPYCAHFHATVDELFDKYGKDGTLAWQYIHLFPFDDRPDAHPNARAQAEAAECAGSIGGEDMFWTFLSRVFEAEEPRDMNAIANDLGLDTASFNACMENNTFADSVSKQQDLSYNTLGLRGTPHSIVILEDGTGYQINGAYPIDTVAITLEAALAGVGAGKIQRFLDMFQEQGVTEATINAYVQTEFIPAITAAQGAIESAE